MLASHARLAAAAARRPRAARALSALAGLDASRLTVARTDSPQTLPPKEKLVFGHTFTDHMLEADWTAGAGWGAPRIGPFHDLQMHPAASSLHYGLQCFEGMKAYIGVDGALRMFRPDMNMSRMRSSCERVSLPDFDGDAFLDCIKELLKVERAWVPQGVGFSLYIRPTAISTHPFLGVAGPEASKLFVILSPVGPYYKSGFAPVQLYADPVHVRAWRGGTGDAKVGGNYAGGIRIAAQAAAKGYSQVLWLSGDDHQVTEVGTMNQFWFLHRKDGGRELLTADLDGTVLPGVTRDSILQLARQWGEFDVSERHYTIAEITEAIDEGRMIESFGTGTAAIVSPVDRIGYDGRDYNIPLDPDNASAGIGKLTKRFADTLLDIQYGKTEHEWSVVVEK